MLQHERLEYFGRKFFQDARIPYASPYTADNFNIPTSLSNWYNLEFLGEHDRRKSLILCSPSRYGKTEWARSLGHHMYFNNMCNFKSDWDDTANYLILDDIEWQFVPNKKGFLGGQKSFVISGKYMKNKTISWNKITIYLCNSLPDFGSDSDWFETNCYIVSLFNKLY